MPKIKYDGFIGPSYTLSSVNVDCQRCVNLYPELDETGRGKGGDVAWLRSTPGYLNLFSPVIGDGPIRLIHVDQPPTDTNNPVTRVFIVSGAKVFKCEYISGAWVNTQIGTLDSTVGKVSAASAKFDLGVTIFVDGLNSYLYWKYISAGPVVNENFGTFASFGYPTVPNAGQVIFQDGYFIYQANGSNQFYVSDWNSVAVDPLSFASAEGDPDDIVAIISNTRDLWLLGERTSEVWVNTGNADFPFERVQGGFIEKGIAAQFSIAKIEGAIFWLGKDVFGKGTVYAAAGLNPQRISTHALEQTLTEYDILSACSGYCYQDAGHSFYVLNLENSTGSRTATWVYDLSTKMWHERAYTEAGVLERHRGNFYAFVPELGIHLIGDWETNFVYYLSNDLYTDNGDTITRLRTSPHISSNLDRIFCNRLTLDIEAGVGTNSGVGVDPQVVMTFSDDGGHTWSSEAWASAGQGAGGLGEYSKRVYWNRQGSFRDRVYSIKITDPVKVALVGAYLDIEEGAS